MEEEKKYELEFCEALKIILDGGAVKGQRFIDGIFLKLNDYGELILVDAARLYAEDTKVFIKSLATQKYRELDVLTMRELSS